MTRIKFYSFNDMSTGYHMNNIVDYLKNKSYLKNEHSLNDIIEMYNIIKYCANNSAEEFLQESVNEDLDAIINSLNSTVGKFLNKISSNILDYYKDLDSEYDDDFWEIIEQYKLYKNVSKQDMILFLQNDISYIYSMLKHKNTVYHFGDEIKYYLLSNPDSAVFLLQEYAEEKDHRNNTLYFPNELTIEDKEQILNNYINSNSPNPNYLRLIKDFKGTSDLKINDKTHLSAKRKLEVQIEQLFKNSAGIESSIEVKFSENQEDAITVDSNGFNWKCSISTEWINENLDFATLLNNFIYLFEFVDSQSRLLLVNQKSYNGLSDQFGVKMKQSYKPNHVFQQANLFSTFQTISYYFYLQNKEIRLEEVIEWFFKEYLKDEFSIDNFSIKMPSENSTYYEKCRAILPELDSVLKQYKLFVDDGNIDKELLQISSNPLLYKEIPSIIETKYVYANISNTDLNRVSHYFFSDQCMLHYLKKFDNKYQSFCSLISSEQIYYDDYKEYQKRDLDWLIKKGYLILQPNNQLKISNPIMISIFKELYENEVLCYNKLFKQFQEEIDKLVEQNFLYTDSTLFSKPEYDYFNYHLNMSSFTDSLDLRNRYLHGTQPDSDNKEIHQQNYIIFLKLFIIAMIKINDELCDNLINDTNKE